MAERPTQTYLGIVPTHETQQLFHYPAVNKLIGSLLRANMPSVSGEHSASYAIGENALHPLVGLYKTEAQGFPVVVTKAKLSAHLDGRHGRAAEHGIRLDLCRVGVTATDSSVTEYTGVPIHRSRSALPEQWEQIKKLIDTGLRAEVGFTALRLEVAPQQETGLRPCTLYGYNEDQSRVVLPFTDAGAEQLAGIMAHTLYQDIYKE